MDDPVAYYTAYVEKLNQEKTTEKVYNFSIKADERVNREGSNSKYYGYVILSKIYHELELDSFFNNKRRHENFKYNSESIMRLLAYKEPQNAMRFYRRVILILSCFAVISVWIRLQEVHPHF